MINNRVGLYAPKGAPSCVVVYETVLFAACNWKKLIKHKFVVNQIEYWWKWSLLGNQFLAHIIGGNSTTL